jgi:hypothetical protein
MNFAATRLAAGSRATLAGSGFGSTAGLFVTFVSIESAVFVHLTATNAITPAARTAPATHGSHLLNVRELKRS